MAKTISMQPNLSIEFVHQHVYATAQWDCAGCGLKLNNTMYFLNGTYCVHDLFAEVNMYKQGYELWIKCKQDTIKPIAVGLIKHNCNGIAKSKEGHVSVKSEWANPNVASTTDSKMFTMDSILKEAASFKDISPVWENVPKSVSVITQDDLMAAVQKINDQIKETNVVQAAKPTSHDILTLGEWDPHFALWHLNGKKYTAQYVHQLKEQEIAAKAWAYEIKSSSHLTSYEIVKLGTWDKKTQGWYYGLEHYSLAYVKGLAMAETNAKKNFAKEKNFIKDEGQVV